MPRAACIVHVKHEGPGLLGEILEEAGYRVDIYDVYNGMPIPIGLGSCDVFVSMGGPMGVADINHVSMPWLEEEVEFLRSRLRRGWPCIGVCLGMQLLAHAAGAAVKPMVDSLGLRKREVGWGKIDFVGTDTITYGLPASMEVLHWHGDAAELPKGAVLLASTDLCPVQMFRIGNSCGVQFHPEIDGPTAMIWAEEDAEFVMAANGPEGVKRLKEESVEAGKMSHKLRRRMLEQMVSSVAR